MWCYFDGREVFSKMQSKGFRPTGKSMGLQTSLKSALPLQASTEWTSTKRLTTQQQKLSSSTLDPLYEVNRLKALERDNYQCCRCGSTFAVAPHHRLPRSAKGFCPEYGLESIHDLSNLISLCAPCHTWVHSGPITEVTDGWLIVPNRNP